jgi:transposase-like protein
MPCADAGRVPGDTWHLDEVYIKIAGKTPYV